ncbi:MAG: DUF4118 domain-containing protein, partial [Proteobacteria bacterium]
LFVLFAHLLKLGIPHQIIHEIPFLIFFSAVVLSGIYGGLGAGLYATALSSLLADYYFIPPTHTFFKHNWHQDFKVALYALDCLTIAVLCGSLKNALDKLKLVKSGELASRRRLEAIFTTSPAAMALWTGPDLKFEMINPQYQALFGNRALLGKPFLEALPEFHDQPFAGLLQAVMETGVPYVGHEELARHASEEGGPLEDHYYDFTYVRLEDDEGGTFGVYDHAVDVTDRVLARQESEKTAAALQASVMDLEQERDLREKFVAALTHDLRTPITSAKLMAQLLERSATTPENARKAQRITASMDRADAMIRDLLDASRIKAGLSLTLKPQHCDITEVAQATMDELSLIYGDRFHFNASGPMHGVWDPTAIRRILENLATNAIKYGAADKPVMVEVSGTINELALSIKNEGSPIPADAQAGLFQLFRRSDAAEAGKQEGWGIGLSLVHGLARAHGGNVGVVSGPELGTTFWVRLRALRSEAGADQMV